MKARRKRSISTKGRATEPYTDLIKALFELVLVHEVVVSFKAQDESEFINKELLLIRRTGFIHIHVQDARKPDENEASSPKERPQSHTQTC